MSAETWWWTKLIVIALADLALIVGLYLHLKWGDEADAARRVDYRNVVIDALTRGIEATRIGTHVFGGMVLTSEEEEEMSTAYETGIPAERFALRLRGRDCMKWTDAGVIYPPRMSPIVTANEQM